MTLVDFIFGAVRAHGMEALIPSVLPAEGTLHILEAVRELQLSSRLVIAGSSTVYGASTEEWDGPVPEEASMKPVSPYGVSKAATEMCLELRLDYVDATGLFLRNDRRILSSIDGGL